MSSTFETLYPASFRGIPFLVSRERVTKGPKTITHDYMSSHYRYVEQAGTYPSEFNLTCIIHGDDSFSKRKNFEKALDEPGFGELWHPMYGLLPVKVIDKFTIDSSDSSVGEHIFNVTFGISEYALIFRPRPGINSNEVSRNAIDNTDSASELFEQKYEEPKSIINLNSVKNQIEDIIENFLGIIDTINEPVENALALFNNTVTKIEDNIYSVISSATNLVLNLNDLYFGFRSIVDDPSKLLDQYFLLIDYAISVINRNTALRIERSNNEILIRDHLNLTLMSFIIEGAVFKDYNTELDLNEVNDKVNEVYNSIFKIDLDPNDDVFRLQEDVNIRNDFAYLYDLFIKNFIEKEQNVYKVKELPKAKNSTFLTAYKYFGHTEFLNIINNLNPAINHCGFNTNLLSITK
jgi:hypothetical protein